MLSKTHYGLLSHGTLVKQPADLSWKHSYEYPTIWKGLLYISKAYKQQKLKDSQHLQSVITVCDYLKGLFHRLSDTQSRMLRNSNTDLRIPLFKTSSGQKSFEFRGARIWNNLSNEAKQASTFLAFKHKL